MFSDELLAISMALLIEDPREYFMIVDDKKMIISSKEKNRPIPTSMGNRKGQIVINEPRREDIEI